MEIFKKIKLQFKMKMQEGDSLYRIVDAAIIELSLEKRKISLSIKELKK